MDNRVWINNSQPQTLYIAQIMLYIRGAMGVLFGPLAPDAAVEGKDEGEDEALEILGRWCPLPLCMAPADSV